MELPAFPNKVWSDRSLEPVSDLVCFERTANIVTLHMVAIHFSQQIENRKRFDTFGNNL